MPPERSNAGTAPADFEFEALHFARNYRRAIVRMFRPFLKGNIIEIGCGIGQMTELVQRLPGIHRYAAIEPDPGFCQRHRASFPHHELIRGTIADAPSDANWDAILSINVLEHIAEDADELRSYARLLATSHGCLCLFVPARPEIYAPIDRDFGHFRRYTLPQLRSRLQDAGFTVLRLRYFNSIGYLAWWLSFCLLKRRAFNPRHVIAFDRMLFPAVQFIESFIPPPIGQSLVAIARAS